MPTHPDQLPHSPIYARKEQVDILKNFLHMVTDSGSAGVIKIFGLRGIGKSYLVDIVRTELEAEGDSYTWHVVQADPCQQQAIRPIISFLEGYFNQSPQQSQSENLSIFMEKIQALLSSPGIAKQISSELERIKSILGALLGLHWEESLYEQLDAKLRFENTIYAIKTLLQAQCIHRPVALVLEDLHEYDPDSLQLLQEIMQSPFPYPVAFIGTICQNEQGIRPEVLSGINLPTQEFEIPIPQTEELKDHLENFLFFLEKKLLPVPEELLFQLRNTTENNPFFAEQLILDLHERRFIFDDGKEWHIPLSFASSGLDIQTTIRSRLSRLPEQLRRTIQSASVLGWTFNAKILALLCDANEQVSDSIQQAQENGFFASMHGNTFRFRNGTFQEVAYQSLSSQRLIELHRSAAQIIFAFHNHKDIATHFAQMAYHADKANDWVNAIDWYYHAAEEAARHFANIPATTFLTRALELTDKLERSSAIEPAKIRAHRYNLLINRENVYSLQGARQSQRQDLTSLQELSLVLSDPIKRAQVSLRQAQFYEAIGDYPTAIAAVHQAINLTRPIQDNQGEAAILLANGFLQLGRIFWRLGEFLDARQPLEYALAMARTLGIGKLEADSLRSLGAVTRYLGNYTEAQEYLTEALHISRRINDLQGESAALNNLGTLTMDQSSFEQAMIHMKDALEIKRLVGDRRGQALTLMNLGAVCSELTNYSQARVYLEDSLAICQEVGDRYNQSMTLNNLGDVTRSLGDYRRAKDYLEQSLNLRRSIGDRRGEGTTTLNLGFVYLKLGDYNQARDLLDKSLKIFRDISFAQGQSWAFSYLGLLCHQINDDEAALVYNRMALRITQEIGDRSTHADALTYQGHSLVRLGLLADAVGSYEYALTLRTELNQPNLALDVLAGMARLYMAWMQPEKALDYVEKILEHLKARTIDGTIEPVRIYATCYNVLETYKDDRASKILEVAHNWLDEKAYLLNDEHLRRTFLENVAAHRILLQTWAENHPPDNLLG